MIHNITIIDKNIFSVKSETSDKYYTVNISDMSCTCPHYEYRLKNTDKKCKHMLFVLSYISQCSEEIIDIYNNMDIMINKLYNHILKAKEMYIEEIVTLYGNVDDIIKIMEKRGMIFTKRGKLYVI